MRAILVSFIGLVLALPFAGTAQETKRPPSESKAALQPVSMLEHSRFVYGVIGRIVVRGAELMPEKNYGFKPADSVRSFGQIVGHIADSHYGFCSAAIGEKNPLPKVELTKTEKGELIEALNASIAYCDRAYAGMTDASSLEMVTLTRRGMPRLGVLNVNQSHTMEHYGNLVTYLRMNGIVPPSSDPEFMQKVAQ
jgi:uncharacterized damage-inducible protein DinB